MLFEYSIAALITLFTALFVVKYIKKKLKRILKTLLKAQALALAFIIFLKSLQIRFVKIQFPKIYIRKNYIDCYNLCQQYEDYFVMTGAKESNQFFFATFFLRDHINFC